MCRNVEICCQGSFITTNLFVLAWKEQIYIVLDLQWLETFGLVLTNYKTLTMEFLVVYDRDLPELIAYKPGTSLVEAGDLELCKQRQLLEELKESLLIAQEHVKRNADKHR